MAMFLWYYKELFNVDIYHFDPLSVTLCYGNVDIRSIIATEVSVVLLVATLVT